MSIYYTCSVTREVFGFDMIVKDKAMVDCLVKTLRETADRKRIPQSG